MFIGHLAGAELLHTLIPSVPPVVSLVGVGFPDLLWGVTILTGLETAKMGTSPLQRDIDFTHYPYLALAGAHQPHRAHPGDRLRPRLWLDGDAGLPPRLDLALAARRHRPQARPARPRLRP